MHPDSTPAPVSTATETPTAIALVNMPFASLRLPSIQCGLLKSILVQAGYAVEVRYLNLRLALAIGVDLYGRLSERRSRAFLCDWLAAADAFGPRADDLEYLQTVAQSDPTRFGTSPEELLRLRNQVIPALLDAWANDKEWQRYAIVGFTCTFDQTVPSFALARRLKLRFPETKIVFGGATFDAETAAEYLEKLDYVDYIVVGEADRTLPALVSRIFRGQPADDLPGVATRARPEIATASQPFLELDTLPIPDYDEYFAEVDLLRRKGATGLDDVGVVFQSARGCWWGEKHPCAFCGIDKGTIHYRSRTPQLVFDEIARQSQRYRTPSFVAADCMLDLRYIHTLFASLYASRKDFRILYEVKANLTREQLRACSLAGVRTLQAGVESLSTHLLALMDKGSNLLINLRLLKWARYYGINVAWNMLSGFPGEAPEDYRAQSRLVPFLTHLQPPNGVHVLALEKHGKYMLNGDAHFRNTRPAAGYAFVFPETIDVSRIALYYDYDSVPNPELRVAVEGLKSAVKEWKSRWAGKLPPALAYQCGPEWAQVFDTRTPGAPKIISLAGKEAAAFEFCSETPRGLGAVVRHLQQLDPSIQPAWVRQLLSEWVEAGLIAEDGGSVLGLAMPTSYGWW
jgi:ribosomal peptide maturation radical SAM protein 1